MMLDLLHLMNLSEGQLLNVAVVLGVQLVVQVTRRVPGRRRGDHEALVPIVAVLPAGSELEAVNRDGSSIRIRVKAQP